MRVMRTMRMTGRRRGRKRRRRLKMIDLVVLFIK